MADTSWVAEDWQRRTEELRRLRFEVRRLTSALLHYGTHSAWCPVGEGEAATAPCGCGWETVRDAARQSEETGDGDA